MSINNKGLVRNLDVDKLVTDDITVAGQLPVLSADGLVKTANIDDGQVTTDKLGDNQVPASLLVDNAVSTNHLKDGAVTADKLYSAAVTEDKLDVGAVTEDKLAAGVEIYVKSKLLHFSFSGEVGTNVPHFDPDSSTVYGRTWGIIPGIPAGTILRECRFTCSGDSGTDGPSGLCFHSDTILSRTGLGAHLAVEISWYGLFQLSDCYYKKSGGIWSRTISNTYGFSYGQWRGTTEYPDFIFGSWSGTTNLAVRYCPARRFRSIETLAALPVSGLCWYPYSSDDYTTRRDDSVHLVFELP